jgi:hypothetical protein
MDYSPASPELLVAGWRAGMPQLPLSVPLAVAAGAAGARRPGSVVQVGAWPALLRASGRPT